MNNSDNLMALVAGYETYVGASELDVSAAADAPASSPACIGFSIASGVASFGLGVSYELTC